MRSVTVISLVALVAQSLAQDADTDDLVNALAMEDVGTDELVDKLVHTIRAKMYARAMKTPFAGHEDMDGATLGKANPIVPFFGSGTTEDTETVVPLDVTRATRQVENLEEEIMTMRKDFRQALDKGKANNKKGRWKAIAAVFKTFRPILMLAAAGGTGDWQLEQMKSRESLVAGALAGVAATAAALVAEARASAAGGGDTKGDFEAVAKKAEQIEGAATKIKDNLKDGLELRTARGPPSTFRLARQAPTDILSAPLAALIGLAAGSSITVALLRLRRSSKAGRQPLLTA